MSALNLILLVKFVLSIVPHLKHHPKLLTSEHVSNFPYWTHTGCLNFFHRCDSSNSGMTKVKYWLNAEPGHWHTQSQPGLLCWPLSCLLWYGLHTSAVSWATFTSVTLNEHCPIFCFGSWMPFLPNSKGFECQVHQTSKERAENHYGGTGQRCALANWKPGSHNYWALGENLILKH